MQESVLLNSPFLQDDILIADTISAVIGASIDIHDRFGVAANPRVSLSWRPSNSYRLSAILGHGYRAPDLLQLFDADFNNIAVTERGLNGYVIFGNPNLDPETDVAWNLQLDFHPRNGVEGFATLFWHDFDDLIQVALCQPPECSPGYPGALPPLVFEHQNVAKARTRGAELSITVDPFEILGYSLASHRIEIDLGYAYLDSDDRSGRIGFDGDELPFRPPHRVLPGATYWQDRWRTLLRVWGQWEDRTYADLPNATIVASHWLWNAKLSAELREALPASWRESLAFLDGFSAFVEANNILDRDVGIPGPLACRSSISTAIVHRLANRNGHISVATVLLAGIAINAIAGAGTGLLAHLATDAQLRDITFWTLGSLAGATWPSLAVAASMLAAALLLARPIVPALDLLLLGESEARHLGVDVEAAKRARVHHLASRSYLTLSGGERQRVMLARALAQIWEAPAQGARYLLLDEPTAALDLAQQHGALEVARAMAEDGTGVLVILHDLNLAARHADRVLLIANGRTVAQGAHADVLRENVLESVFGIGVRVVADPADGLPLVFARAAAAHLQHGSRFARSDACKSSLE